MLKITLFTGQGDISSRQSYIVVQKYQQTGRRLRKCERESAREREGGREREGNYIRERYQSLSCKYVRNPKDCNVHQTTRSRSAGEQ